MQWTLLNERATYLFSREDDRPFERSYGDLGRTFPHSLGEKEKLYASVRFTPMGDELTLAFVKTLIAREQLGRGGSVDFLAVGFSCTDAIGHAFGPNSLEAEDNLLRLDRTLADLFEFVDAEIGLQNTLIVLSSDHGVDAAPELTGHLRPVARGASGRVDPRELVKATNTILKEHFKTDRDFTQTYRSACLYLDTQAIAELGLDLAQVEEVAALAIAKMPGVA